MTLRRNPDATPLLDSFQDADAYFNAMNETGVGTDMLRDAQERRDLAYRELIQGSAEFRERTLIPSVKVLQAKLSSDTTAFELVRYQPFVGQPGKVFGEPEYGGFLVTKTDLRWINLGSAAEIETLAASLRRTLPIRHNAAISREIAMNLFGRLLEPIPAQAPGVGPIFLSPDGPLMTLPWGALTNWAGLNRPIHIIGHSRDLLSREYESKTVDHIIAGPDYGDPPVPKSVRGRQEAAHYDGTQAATSSLGCSG